jgi:hypothetical protein
VRALFSICLKISPSFMCPSAGVADSPRHTSPVLPGSRADAPRWSRWAPLS